MIGLIFTAVGVLLLAGAIWFWQHGKARHTAAMAWTRTEARIDDVGYRRSHMNNQTTYQPVISYRFYADGTEFTGTRSYLVAKSNFNSHRAAEEWAGRHLIGSVVPVWFDPLNPTDAALELNKPSAFLIGLFIGIGALFTMIGMVLVASLPEV